MNTVAKFEKVSFEQFKKDWLDTFYDVSETSIGVEEIENRIRRIYDNIKLPKRSTVSSAGYDFFAPEYFELYHNDVIKIPTGIRCSIKEDWVLMLFPRSGQGFKYGVHLSNGVGIVDSDYYNADNEGHIFFQLVNFLPFDVVLKKGDCIGQGIFLPYAVVENDVAEGDREGGFGSTDETPST